MSGRFSTIAGALVPQKLSSRFIYRLSRSEISWLKRLLIWGFCRLYDIRLSEAKNPDPKAYPSFNEFFTRQLRDGARPLDGDDKVIVSPCDGCLTEFGTLDDDRLVQAKGKTYTVDALLAESPELVAAFRGGSYMTIYLAPNDYHRVHAPTSGRLDRARYIPGRRFSVNAGTAARIDSLYCRNERVALWLSAGFGYSVVVMVGALNVSSLTTVLTGEIESGQEQLFASEAPPELARAAEIGQFNLGSTVVLLFPRGTVSWLESLQPGQSLRMGQALGTLTAND